MTGIAVWISVVVVVGVAVWWITDYLFQQR
jgi:hypothetical protein